MMRNLSNGLIEKMFTEELREDDVDLSELKKMMDMLNRNLGFMASNFYPKLKETFNNIPIEGLLSSMLLKTLAGMDKTIEEYNKVHTGKDKITRKELIAIIQSGIHRDFKINF